MADKNSFLKGALILTVAGFIVKALGALYRIPLALLIKDEGMGLYQMDYPIYLILLSIYGRPTYGNFQDGIRRCCLGKI